MRMIQYHPWLNAIGDFGIRTWMSNYTPPLYMDMIADPWPDPDTDAMNLC